MYCNWFAISTGIL